MINGIKTHGLFKDLTGIRFGNLRVEKFVEFRKDKHGLMQGWWNCVCECGEQLIVKGRDLRRGHKVSCGCRNTERMRKCAARKRKPGTYLNIVFAKYKVDASKRGHRFVLSKKFFESLIHSACFYCGAPPSPYNPYGHKKNNWNESFCVNGIDRIDPNKGYVKDNVVPSCKHCNYAKRNQTQQEFFSLVEKIYEKHVRKHK